MPELSAKSTETVLESVPQAQKTQFVRLYIDILLIAPFLIYLSSKKGPLGLKEKSLLATIGLGVLYYNGRRYLINRDILKNKKIL